MVAPTLNPLTYQYLDGGVLLNGPSAIPFFDVDQVVGFDLPDVKRDMSDVDGAHGGYVYARYLQTRLWVITGTAYGSPTATDSTSIDDYLELLRANFLPQSTDQPFYTRLGGTQTQRISYCKPVSFKHNYDRGRSIGQVPCTIQLEASDPRQYGPPQTQAFTAGATHVIINNGNTSDYPKYAWDGSALTLSDGSAWSVAISALPTSLYTLDLALLRIYETSTGVDFSSYADFSSVPGFGYRLVPGGGGNSVHATAAGTLTYADAWL